MNWWARLESNQRCILRHGFTDRYPRHQVTDPYYIISAAQLLLHCLAAGANAVNVVPLVGFEPTRLKATDFKSVAFYQFRHRGIIIGAEGRTQTYTERAPYAKKELLSRSEVLQYRILLTRPVYNAPLSLGYLCMSGERSFHPRCLPSEVRNFSVRF